MEQTSTILIVDDEPSGRETLRALLVAYNYHLVFASDGMEALAQATATNPDLILLDVMMPGMDGFEVCKKLRADPRLSEVPVIMVTALDDRESRLEGIAAGADDFISKPFDRTELRARVHTITRLNRYRRLIDQRTRYDQLIELSPDGVLIVDQAHNIGMANPAMITMLQRQNEQEIIGRPLAMFVSPAHHTLAQNCVEQILQQPTMISIELEFVVMDGKPLVQGEVHAGHVVWNDQPAVQLIVRDVTERKMAEAEHIRLLRKLAERERRLQYLVEKMMRSQEEERRRVAYELHDGLAQVASSTHQQLQTYASLYYPDDTHASSKLDAILVSAQRVVKEARQVIAGMRPTLLDDFGLASALRMEIENLRENGWDIVYEESSMVYRMSPTIETTFYRVAQEALTNVRNHANTTRVRVVLRCDEHIVHFEVQDWGDGFVIDQNTVGAGQESGYHIGLAGMEERIHLINGEFRIFSEPGKGTLVIAEAPQILADEPENEEQGGLAISPSQPTGHRTRLVIADDHDLSRAGVRSMLEGEHGLELVGEATNGREALELCQRLHPHLALLDVRMPEMDGLQATRAIKQTCPETSVIIVTMHENVEYLIAAMRAGAAGYLLKDTSRREFLSAVWQVVRGESFLNTDLTRRMLINMQTEATQPKATLEEPLTPREQEVLQLLAQGQTNRQIAANLIISPLTVKVHVQRIIAKLGVSDRTHAAVRAMEVGLL